MNKQCRSCGMPTKFYEQADLCLECECGAKVKDAVNKCLDKRDAEWAKALGWPDIAERTGPMYPDDVQAFVTRRNNRALDLVANFVLSRGCTCAISVPDPQRHNQNCFLYVADYIRSLKRVERPLTETASKTFNCDVCGEDKPLEEKHHSFPYGIETTWCNGCDEVARRTL